MKAGCRRSSTKETVSRRSACAGTPEPVELAPGHEAACHFPEGVGGRSEVAERAMDFASGG